MPGSNPGKGAKQINITIMENFKIELTQVLLNTMNFCGNCYAAAKDCFADNNIKFNEQLFCDCMELAENEFLNF